jgi:hypothetical protein
MKDVPVFEGKELSHILQEIYTNSEKKREILYSVIRQLRDMIKDVDTAMMIGPVLKEYIDVLTRSDEHLVKIATLIQRAVTAQTGGGDPSQILTADEKRQLLEQATVELDKQIAKFEKVKELPVGMIEVVEPIANE